MTASHISGLKLMAISLGLALGVAALPRLSTAETGLEQVSAIYRQALEAYEKKDYATYYEGFSRLSAILPNDPGVVFRLAGASALTGRVAEAESLLKRLTAMQVDRDLVSSPDFVSIHETAAFKAAVTAMESLKAPVGTETIAFRLPERDFIPEGIAWDPVTRTFLVSSVHLRKVVRVGRDGAVRDLVQAGQDGLWSALGIDIDPGRRILWVCSTAYKQIKGATPGEEGQAALFAFHADSGKLLGRYPLAGGVKGHGCDSLAVGPRGDVYVSDGETGAIYRLRRGAKALEAFLAGGSLYSAQSLAFPPGGKALFIADYARGVVGVDLSSRKVTLLPAPQDAALGGIDGLAYYGGSLLAVQNGVQPNRVLRLRLSSRLDRIESVEVLARSLPIYDEPTLATVVDRALYYIANSHWGKFDERGALPEPEKLSEPAILKIPLG
ncbi:MAG TPA: hypothetical protein VGX68_10365 [Thermoanaerobaculia bacterium]|jgi:sugar lactone lactonase YvrE|nr:hypothetical protein [Thermoanaerobaculia bacterium]